VVNTVEHEVSLATVEPRRRIAHTVKFGKFNLVDGVRGLIAADGEIGILTAPLELCKG
jgi:hypothetical protein